MLEIGSAQGKIVDFYLWNASIGFVIYLVMFLSYVMENSLPFQIIICAIIHVLYYILVCIITRSNINETVVPCLPALIFFKT